jgi:hypothetical protein
VQFVLGFISGIVFLVVLSLHLAKRRGIKGSNSTVSVREHVHAVLTKGASQ